jgi:uncharacterized cupin superfamily protein
LPKRNRRRSEVIFPSAGPLAPQKVSSLALLTGRAVSEIAGDPSRGHSDARGCLVIAWSAGIGIIVQREVHMASNKVTKLGPKAATPIETDLDGWKKIEGNPTMKTWIEYTADDGSSISGWWGATPGTYRATYAAPEFVHMIEGEIVITPDGGKPVTVKSGDAFVVEKDFVGTWKIEKEVFKHFTIMLK